MQKLHTRIKKQEKKFSKVRFKRTKDKGKQLMSFVRFLFTQDNLFNLLKITS